MYIPNNAAVIAVGSIIDQGSSPRQTISLTDLSSRFKEIEGNVAKDNPVLRLVGKALEAELRKPDVNLEQNVECVFKALRHYQKCMSTYMQHVEFQEAISNHSEDSDLSENLKTNLQLISETIPENILHAFGPRIQLCIRFWTTLPFLRRSLLKIAALKTMVFQEFSKCKFILHNEISDLFLYDGEPLYGKPHVAAVDVVLSEITSLLAGHGTLDMSRIAESADDPDIYLKRNEITASCMIMWKLERQKSSENRLVNTFNITIYGAEVKSRLRTEEYDANKKTLYVGPMSKVTATQLGVDSISKHIMNHVGNYQFQDLHSKLLVSISPGTSFLPDVTLDELLTLKSETWISSKIIAFGLHSHALCTGACCDMFPDPLPSGTKIYYACFWFYSLYVKGKTTWTAGTNWDWLIAPTFVDSGHFITLAISFTQKKICALDSSPIKRDAYLSNLLRWVQTQGVDASEANGWTKENIACPQQGNCFDCGIFALLSSAYLPVCMPATLADHKALSEHYGQRDAARVRGFLAESIYRSGETFRASTCKWALLP